MPRSPRTRPTGRRLAVLLAAVTLVPGLAACGGDDDGGDGGGGAAPLTIEQDPSQANAPTPEAAAAACKDVRDPGPRGSEPDEPRPKPATLSGMWTVSMTTNCGSFSIRLDTARQPRTAASFKALVVSKFFDGLTFHRISPGFVIQGGDPQGDGSGGPGYSVRETPPPDAAYTRGVVAMAKTGNEPAGTSGSQFFVITAEDSGLPPDYAIVGRVVSGLETIDRIAALGTGDQTPPREPVVISKATAEKG